MTSPITHAEDQAKGRAEAEAYLVTINGLIATVGDLGRSAALIREALDDADYAMSHQMCANTWFGHCGFFPLYRAKLDSEIAWARKRLAKLECAAEWHTTDKAAWERGPWDAEPDKLQWIDAASNLPCVIMRGPCGQLNGYIGVPVGHPWHRLDYDAIEPHPEVHGGLTYAGDASEIEDPLNAVCWVGEEFQDHWWLGFDCAHLGDYTSMSSPASIRAAFPHRGDVYRGVAFVRAETERLAAQGIDAPEGGCHD